MNTSHFAMMLIAATTTLAGCAADIDGDDHEDVGETEQALGEMACVNASSHHFQDAWDPGSWDTWSSADGSYSGGSGCPHQFMVDIVGTNSHEMDPYVAFTNYGDINTSGSCGIAHLTMGFYKFSTNGDIWSLVGTTRKHGVWVPIGGGGFCTFEYDTGYSALGPWTAGSDINGVVVAGSAFKSILGPTFYSVTVGIQEL